LADYFTSDVHLRFDEPGRARRFARFVDALGAADSLTVAGDLCDFWLSSRQRRRDPRDCPGLRSLLDLASRGGRLRVLLGNHDAWLGPLYDRWFGPVVAPEPLEVLSHGLRVLAVHGHLLGARKPWKAAMEGRAFLRAFEALPEPVARLAEGRLKSTNDRNLARTHARHLAVYRDFARRQAPRADLVLFGHVHETFDEPAGPARLIVLGDWFEGGSYLRIDEHGPLFARLQPGHDADAQPRPSPLAEPT
jgi:UDP-2,3-diacylglucosamine hydrolase